MVQIKPARRSRLVRLRYSTWFYKTATIDYAVPAISMERGEFVILHCWVKISGCSRNTFHAQDLSFVFSREGGGYMCNIAFDEI